MLIALEGAYLAMQASLTIQKTAVCNAFGSSVMDKTNAPADLIERRKEGN
jgi:hypothetical protein